MFLSYLCNGLEDRLPGNAKDSSTGFSNWKDATVGFANPEKSTTHKQAVEVVITLPHTHVQRCC